MRCAFDQPVGKTCILQSVVSHVASPTEPETRHPLLSSFYQTSFPSALFHARQRPSSDHFAPPSVSNFSRTKTYRPAAGRGNPLISFLIAFRSSVPGSEALSVLVRESNVGSGARVPFARSRLFSALPIRFSNAKNDYKVITTVELAPRVKTKRISVSAASLPSSRWIPGSNAGRISSHVRSTVGETVDRLFTSN